nr:hypothetical protein [Tanacetum cinerariifolium]
MCTLHGWLEKFQRVGFAYRILVFGCEATCKLQQSLANKMSLGFERCISFKIPHPTCQPTIRCLVLTGCVGPVIYLILSRVPVKEQHVRSNDEIRHLDENIIGVAMGDDMLQEFGWANGESYHCWYMSWRASRFKAISLAVRLSQLQSKVSKSHAIPTYVKLLWILIPKDNISRDVITVGSTMRIPLLYRGEYSQWRERFMNYLEEQTDGEAMINSIQNGDQPLPIIAQVSLAGTVQNAPPTLKDPNNETAKDLWDALERQMRGSEYGEQDRKAAILYEYETFKAIEGEQLLDTYLRYLQVINDLKKCGYKKDKCELNYKFLNNLQPEWKQYGTLIRQTKNLMDINIDALYNILKQNQGNMNDALGYKKKTVVVHSDPLALVAEKTNMTKKDSDEQVLLAEDQAWMESSSDSDQEINANMVFMAQIEKVLSESDESSSSVEENIVEVAYYTTESKSESNENFIKNHIDSQKDYDKSEVDHNDSEEKEHLVDKLIQKFNHKIAKCQKRIEKANQQSKNFENQNKDLQEKYDVLINQVNTFEEKNNEFNDQIKVLNEKNADLLDQTKVLKDQLQVKHVVIDTHVECHKKYAKLEAGRYEYMIRYSALFNNDKQHRKQITDQEVLFDKMSVELVELDKHVNDLKNTVLEKDFKIFELEECVRNKALEIEKCLERLNDCENKLHKMGQTNLTVHMIMPSKDNLYNGRKEIGFENPSYFEKAKDSRPTLYDEKDDYFQEIINPDFEKIDSPFQQTSSLKLYVPNVILEKIIIDLEDEVVNLLEKEKVNLKTIESLKSKGFESSETAIYESENQSENDCLVVENECDKRRIQSKLKRKRRKRKSSKQNDKQVNNDVSCANSDFVYFSDLDTFSSVRRPKNNGVIWNKKGSSNTSNVDLSAVNLSKLNKNVK